MISILSVSYISQKLRVILSFCVVTILKDLFLSIFYETLYLLSLSSLDNEPKATWGKNTEEFIVSKIMVNAIIKLYRKRGEGGGSYWNARLWSKDVQLPSCFNRWLCLSKIKNVLIGMNLWIISLRISSVRDL